MRTIINLQNHPLICNINAAGWHMGLRNRADAGENVRAYIERKKEAIAACFPPYMTVKSGYVTIRHAKGRNAL